MGIMSLNDYTELVRELGFVQVYEESFVGRPVGIGSKNQVTEHFFVFFHRDGILLSFDTYGSCNVNGGNLYYNVKVGDDSKHHAFETGSYKSKHVWGGNHDCRWCLEPNMDGLREAGQFLNPWKYDPGVVWLVHYGDKDELGEDWDNSRHHEYSIMAARKTIERAAKMPQNVQDCIAVSIAKFERELKCPT